jgi:DNA-binding XRE family transcriptional regulator
MALDEAMRAGTPASNASVQAPSNAALGRTIRRLRRERRLTIEAVALAARMHPTYLSGIERGERNPTWSKLGALANTLGIPVSALAREAEHDICPVCGALSCKPSRR